MSCIFEGKRTSRVKKCGRLYLGIERKTSLQVDVIVKLYELRNPSLRALLQNAFGILLKPPAEVGLKRSRCMVTSTPTKRDPDLDLRGLKFQNPGTIDPNDLQMIQKYSKYISGSIQMIQSTSMRFNASMKIHTSITSIHHK